MGICWLALRAVSIAALDREERGGINIEWEIPFYGHKVDGKRMLLRYLPGAQVTTVVIQAKMTDPIALGRALRHFGNVENLYISADTTDRMHAMLDHIGYQPRVLDMQVDEVPPLDDRLMPVLAKFSSLERLYATHSNITGEAFPTLAQLSECTLKYAPITDEGLQRISKCPRLRKVHLRASRVSPEAVMDFVSESHPELIIFSCNSTKITAAQAAEIQAKVTGTAPGFEFYLD